MSGRLPDHRRPRGGCVSTSSCRPTTRRRGSPVDRQSAPARLAHRPISHPGGRRQLHRRHCRVAGAAGATFWSVSTRCCAARATRCCSPFSAAASTPGPMRSRSSTLIRKSPRTCWRPLRRGSNTARTRYRRTMGCSIRGDPGARACCGRDGRLSPRAFACPRAPARLLRPARQRLVCHPATARTGQLQRILIGGRPRIRHRARPGRLSGALRRRGRDRVSL